MASYPPQPNRGGTSSPLVDFVRLSLFPGFEPTQPRIEALVADQLGSDVSVTSGSMRHFPHAFDLRARSDAARVGGVGFGAKHGRTLFELTGRGCRYVRSWPNLNVFARVNQARLTRLDVAVDLFGEYTVEQAVVDAVAGKFNRRRGGNSSPSIHRLGTWDCSSEENQGRTVYVRSGGWQIMIYEKGIKGGGARDWVRVEVKAMREEGIALAALLDSGSVWAEYCPSLKHLIPVSVPIERTERSKRNASVFGSLKAMQSQWGGFIADLRVSGMPDPDIVDLVAGGHVGRVLRADAFSVLCLEAALSPEVERRRSVRASESRAATLTDFF